MKKLQLRAGPWFVAAGLLLWACAHHVGALYGGYALQLGASNEMEPRTAVLVLHFVLLGGGGALLLATGLAQFCVPLPSAPGRSATVRLVGGLAALAALGAILLRLLVLHESDITDDESVYRFGAALLLQGKLSEPSHALKVFFDHAFMANDGRYVSQYFLGWPAMLAPFQAVGEPGFAGSFYFALSVPAVYRIARELVPRAYALAAVVLFVGSPLSAIGAATELSHTGSMALLAWTWAVWLWLRRRDAAAPAWGYSLLATLFCGAFFVRPYTALALGAPMLSALASSFVRTRSGRRAFAFLAVCAGVASVFLGVNWAQSGSPLVPAYQHVLHYAVEQDYFLSHITKTASAAHIVNLRFQLGPQLAQVGAALTRLWPAVLGWPLPLFMVFALPVRRAAPIWQGLASFMAFNALLFDPGIDSYGPVHYTEVVLPVVLLSAVGMRAAHCMLRQQLSCRPDRAALATRAVVFSFVCMALAGGLLFWPPRLRALAQLAAEAHYPDVAAAALPAPALVFWSRSFAYRCVPGAEDGPGHFRYWAPVNEPGFHAPVVWANHLDIDADLQLARTFPQRTPFLMAYDLHCRLHFLPLDAPQARAVSTGLVRLVRNAKGRLISEHYDPKVHAQRFGVTP